MKMSKRWVPAVIGLLLCLWANNLYAEKKTSLKYDLFSVSFPSQQEGWASGRWGTILHTKDGGATWVKQSSGTDYTLSSIFFTDLKTGWAVGNGGTVIHTVDGGQSWVKQKSPVDYYLMGAYFADSRTGWIVTERTTILHTKDGGDSWVVQFSDEDFVLKSISFSDSQTGWAVGEYGYIYHTNNGGKIWQKQVGNFEINKYGDVVGGNYLFDVVTIDPMTAWVVGIDGYVAKTVDGGKSWQQVEGNFPKTQFFKVVTNRQDLFLIGGRDGILKSSDKGKTFSPVNANPPLAYGWIYGIAPRGEKGFIAVGREGWIYQGNPDGLSWKKTN